MRHENAAQATDPMTYGKGPSDGSSVVPVNPTIVKYDARIRGVPEDQRHDCCVPSCTTQTTPGWLACRDHYLRLPASVRNILRRAFTQRERRPNLYAEAVTVATRLIITAAGETP